MCRGENTNHNSKKHGVKVLFSLKSFDCINGSHPSISSCALFGILTIGVLTSFEFALRVWLNANQHLHPLLENETNRQILARHMGVDTVSCIVCASLGFLARDVCADIFKIFFYLGTKYKDGDDNKKTLMHPAEFGHRLFTYTPSAFRVSLFFFWYQVKNTYDTIVWGDGPEFIFHHVFSLFTAYGSMSTGVGHFYAIFFFGISEVSTAVLCILANFDDVHGVNGLGKAFPITKVFFAAFFVIFFIICRCVLWPVFAYYFGCDVLTALKSSDPRVKGNENWMKFFLVSLSGISFLQVAWLGQIFILGKKELESIGIL